MNQHRKKFYTGIIILIALFAITFFIFTKDKKTEARLPSDGSKASVYPRLDQVKAGVETTTPKPEATNPPLLKPPSSPLSGGNNLPSLTRGGREGLDQTVTVLAGNTTIHLAPNTTFYDALLQAKNQGQINFAGKNYPGLGFFVTEIGSLRAGKGKYLLYYVNGQQATVGVSAYALRDGDVIEWRLE